jgi:hypothetical protein
MGRYFGCPGGEVKKGTYLFPKRDVSFPKRDVSFPKKGRIFFPKGTYLFPKRDVSFKTKGKELLFNASSPFSHKSLFLPIFSYAFTNFNLFNISFKSTSRFMIGTSVRFYHHHAKQDNDQSA